MMSPLRVAIALFYALLIALFLSASVAEAANTKAKRTSRPAPKYAALVVDSETGAVLFDRYADSTRYPASLTKMMTLYLLFEELDAGRLTTESKLKVSALAANQAPSKLGLAAGDTIDVDTAIKALVVKSANDVAVVIAEAVSGSEWKFAKAMTEKARQLGMKRTTFRNASGLPNSLQVTTARDLAVLTRRVISDFPQYYPYFSATTFEHGERTHLTHNALVRTYSGAEGMKTGYTRISGFNLVTTASRDGRRLVGVVLGGRSVRTRDAHMRELLDNAFAALKSKPSLIASAKKPWIEPRLKPTLVAELERAKQTPTIADAPMQDALLTASEMFASDQTSEGNGAGLTDDTIRSLIASADAASLNEAERQRLAASAPALWAEGDSDEGFGGAAQWSVQIGAYSTHALAEQELALAASAIDAEARAQSIEAVTDPQGKELFRSRFVSLTAGDASALCQSLKQSGKTCFIVSSPAAPAP